MRSPFTAHSYRSMSTGSVLRILGPFLAVMGVGLSGPGSGWAWAQPPTPPSTFSTLVNNVRHAVVNVEVETRDLQQPAGPPQQTPEDFLERFFGNPFAPGAPLGPEVLQGAGSGFVINPEGLILTNNHVVEGATYIRVTFEDGREFRGKVAGRDPLTDIAVVKLEQGAKDLPFVRLGDSEALKVGDWVVAIGNPFGLASSVSAGILSAKARELALGPYDDFLQTDAAINPGNSGGPLFNNRGDVVGINTAIVGGGAGIGFAVPSNLIKSLLPQLVKNGFVERGWMGVYVQDLDPTLAEALSAPQTKGAVVTQLEPGSPAEKAGLKPDDVILALDGEPLPSASALTRRVALDKPGTTATLKVSRGGQPQEIRVELGRRPDTESAKPPATPPKEQAPQRFGLTIRDVPPEVKSQLTAGESGALVTDVLAGSPAGLANFEPGMVIVAAGDKPIRSAAELVEAINRAPPGKPLLLRIRVPGTEARLLRALPIPSKAPPK